MNRRFRFESFVTGPSNRLAVSAARSVADAPGKVYHPFFLYAESGLGKTHLLNAIGHQATETDSTLTAEYCTAEEYIAGLRTAGERGDLNAWRRQWESVTLLLLDDVQFLEGHADAQSELLRLIDQAQGRGCQVVLASDRPPADLEELDQRLLSRMSGGLVADIAAPELETRLGILRLWRDARKFELDDETLDELAGQDVENVRELLGLLNRALAHRSLRPVTSGSGSMVAVPAPRVRQRTPPPDEFENFLKEVSAVVTSSVEQWRVRLAATVARWAGEGYATGMLEQFLDGIEPPDVDAVEASFANAVHQLRDLEREAARLDPKLGGLPVFRDPGRLEEARTLVMRALAAYDPPPAPAAHLTIETFSSGARNTLALRSASEVIALPGSRYNPLYIHGPHSSGKTLLANAIANALAAREGGASTVAVVDGAALCNELIEALRSGSLDRWRLRYRSADALVVDNVHRIGGSDRLQEEFFHLFNTFVDAGRQVVLTSDVPPARLPAIVSRLQSRFESGLVVEIGHVSEAEAVARHTPVPDGDEAAAPTIDAWFDDAIEPEVVRHTFMDPVSGIDSFFLDPEKVVTEWPGLDGRVVEDPR